MKTISRAGCSEAELKNAYEEAIKDIPTFYKQYLVKYDIPVAISDGTEQSSTELIAGWIKDDKERFEQFPWLPLPPKYYPHSSHNGDYKGKNGYKKDFPIIDQNEKLIAMEIFNRHKYPDKPPLGTLGHILDYEVPLVAGLKTNIDLLAYDGKNLRILELKKPSSEESMLRCICESYSYLNLVCLKKLKYDLGKLEPPVTGDTHIIACPLVFEYANGYESGERSQQYNEIKKDHPKLSSLMETWDIEPYYIYWLGDDKCFTVKRIK
jgi:hypothetical protein